MKVYTTHMNELDASVKTRIRISTNNTENKLRKIHISFTKNYDVFH